MRFSIPLLLSVSSLAFALPVAESEVNTATESQVTTTEHLATTAHFFEKAAAVVTTENGLTTDACKPVIVIFARGTNEGMFVLRFRLFHDYIISPFLIFLLLSESPLHSLRLSKIISLTISQREMSAKTSDPTSSPTWELHLQLPKLQCRVLNIRPVYWGMSIPSLLLTQN